MDIIKNYLEGSEKSVKVALNFCTQFSQGIEFFLKKMIILLDKDTQMFFGNNNPNLAGILNKSINHILDGISSYEKIKQQFYVDCIETLNEFKNQYLQNSSEFMKKLRLVMNFTLDQRKMVNLQKDKYENCYKKRISLEKDLKYLIDSPKKQNLEVKKKQYNELISQTDNEEKKYLDMVQKCNERITESEYEYKSVVDNIVQNERSKDIFIFNTLSKIPKYLQKTIDLIQEKENMITSILNNTNTSEFKFNFENISSKIESAFFHREECLIHVYDESTLTPSPKKDSESDSSFGPHEDKKENVKKLQCYEKLEEMFNKLILDDKSINKIEIIDILTSLDGRQAFTNILMKISSPLRVNSLESLNIIGELVIFFLNSLLYVKDLNLLLLYSVLNASRYLFFKSNKLHKIFLYNLVLKHQVWTDHSRWKSIIESVIEYQTSKFMENYERIKQNRQARKNSFSILLNNSFDLGIKLIKSITSSENLAFVGDKDLEKGFKNTVFETLVNFAFLFSIFNISKQESFQILFYFAFNHSLSNKNITEIFLEFSNNQPYTISNDPKALITKAELQKEYFQKDLGISKILVNCIKFINNKKQLQSILILSKQIKSDVKRNIYKQLLINLNHTLRFHQRINIWEQLIDISTFDVSNYENLNNFTVENSEEMKNANEVILMDVQRSFPNIKEISPEKLSKILRIYAFYEQKVEYCQGMNFITGFLYLIFKDERKTFRILKLIIDKYLGKDLFKADMPLLMKSFFILDKLIITYMPELQTHFKSETISSSHFSSSWLVTIFTYSLQHSKNGNISEFLLLIWDYFLVYKWKGLYAIILFILDEMQESLVEMKFNDIMHNLGAIIKTQLFKSNEKALLFKQFYRKINLTNKIIDKITSEYNHLENLPNRLGEEYNKEKPNDMMDIFKFK